MPGKEGEEMNAENRFHDIDPHVYQKEFSEPIHRVGMITCGLAILGMFLPPAWLYFQYGVFPPLSAIMVGMGLALTYAVPFFIIEPISYYPTLGDAGDLYVFFSRQYLQHEASLCRGGTGCCRG